ncbi:phosphonate C-P lyase system protein PhnH [Prosthecomicrobium sp. N25]|uniref:phosphonate C-P lyase system protein PhnH n=1 Tax=Prosthecomicrobium sp. N25 TaxID=3129254 RepID=UPI0030785C33
MNVPVTAAGFDSPVHDAQATFRSAMRALAEPGTIRTVEPALVAPGPVGPAVAALLLALADFETPVWLDAGTLAAPGLADFLRFQTGAPVTADPGRASFGVVSDPAAFEGLDRFAQGTLEYPDRSTTLIVQVASLAAGGPFRLSGPGIPGERRLAVAPEIPGLVESLSRNHERFPRGVDLILAAGDRIVGLPRTTRVMRDL